MASEGRTETTKYQIASFCALRQIFQRCKYSAVTSFDLFFEPCFVLLDDFSAIAIAPDLEWVTKA